MAAIDATVLSVTRPEIEELVQKQRSGAKRLREIKGRISHTVVVMALKRRSVHSCGSVTKLVTLKATKNK